MANRYRSLNTTHVFPTAIRHAIPPKPSSALAQKPTVKLSIYSLTHTGAFSKFPKSAASQSTPCVPSENVKLKT